MRLPARRHGGRRALRVGEAVVRRVAGSVTAVVYWLSNPIRVGGTLAATRPPGGLGPVHAVLGASSTRRVRPQAEARGCDNEAVIGEDGLAEGGCLAIG